MYKREEKADLSPLWSEFLNTTKKARYSALGGLVSSSVYVSFNSKSYSPCVITVCQTNITITYQKVDTH